MENTTHIKTYFISGDNKDKSRLMMMIQSGGSRAELEQGPAAVVDSE